MIARGIRRLRRWVGGNGRWVRPVRASLAALTVIVALAAGAAGWGWTWANASLSPARTLALAASVEGMELPLDSALEVTWTWSVNGAGALEDRWLGLVAPGLPPGLCLPGDGGPGVDGSAAGGGDGAAGGRPAGALGAALRRLDHAVRRGASREELERRLREVREVADVGPGTREAFLTRYGLARGHAAAGDWAAAADLLEPALEGWISPVRVPETRRDLARTALESGRMTRALAVDALHGRVLAGTVAYHRGEPERAVAYFRQAINGVYYLLALDGADGLAPDVHYRRVSAEAGEAACAESQPVLTSLDAYAGLVAAYMADADFSDPAGLAGEVSRTRLQIDPDDPFAPVLEHARRTGGRSDRTPVPEHLLWAASNLQRVYHHNRLRPDPRLEVTRAVLLLHLTGDPAWTRALAGVGGADPCGMLGSLASDLHRDGAASQPLGSREPAPADSARAAVAVQAFVRLERDCPGQERPEIDGAVRSAWIRLGGGYLTRGLGGRYEGVRVGLAATLAQGSAPVPVVEGRLQPGLERVANHLRWLERGRIPPDLPVDLPVDPVRRYAREWWSAVFGDVARALAGATREPALAGGIRAGQVPEYLAALESAVDHAGLRPADVYTPGETAPLVRAAEGWSGELAWRVRTSIRNHPRAWAALLGAAAALVGLAALLVHVSWWRYHLLTDQRFYVEELRAHERRAAA